MRPRSESHHDAFKVMLVFESDVLIDQLEASRYPVINIHSGHDRSTSPFSAVLEE
jgi:hypothetical protein